MSYHKDGEGGVKSLALDGQLECLEFRITSPGTYLRFSDDELARKITCQTNEEVHEVCREYPDKFSFFASLLLPDVEGSLQEIDYALDILGAVRFALMTNAQGYYLGDAHYARVFEKLNQRKAVIFVHPTDSCSLDHPEGAGQPLNQYPAPMIEYIFNTTCAVVNPLLSGTVEKYPNIHYVISHCGTLVAPIVQRFTQINSFLTSSSFGREHVKELFNTRFYFDLAGFPFPNQIHTYLAIGHPSQLLYGSDYPYTPRLAVDGLSGVLDQGL